MSITGKIILIRTVFSFLLLWVVSHQACLMAFPAVGTEQPEGSESATGVRRRGFLWPLVEQGAWEFACTSQQKIHRSCEQDLGIKC